MPETINTPAFLKLTPTVPKGSPAVRINAMFDQRAGSYATANLTVESPVESITPTRLAKMRLGALRRDALRLQLGEENAVLARRAPVKSYFRGTPGRAVAEKARLEPTPEHLENAGLVYRLARIVGDYPVQAVSRCFGLEVADAHRWVRLAKKTGAI
ncbi:hypothetical protein OVA26_16660 [Microbacterium sp. SL62]|uniref:hypothetical protein n=1 Tax=Microbacterium sp. SL62 TaxID=2995139 RepID=UPI002275FFE3|nr:hypothetical protein [Microbacterium sp. SL62]MCY1718570.1 hypothetical protein [Microbacterium sp. SL62]